jgi:dihydrodipicolinate synthase/N-acetylneuraminate lyase
MSTTTPGSDPQKLFGSGLVIPAVPLALNPDRSFDSESEKTLLRYYVDAGAGGIAIGVHSTQFAIRDIPGFYDKLLNFASRTVDEWAERDGREMVKIAGICGTREQALEEARMAHAAGFHAGLLSLTALSGRPMEELLEHVRSVSEAIPVIGFYLQTAVGGMYLPYEFWREFAKVENVWGIKMAPFDRYATLAVLRGVADSGRADEIALYTGNDDTIVTDLITRFRIGCAGGTRAMRIVGGLLGHWGVWTKAAVELLERCQEIVQDGDTLPAEILTLAAQVTDMSGAIFDAAHGYAGCLPGVHEVLRRQGIFHGIICLDPGETLSDGQEDEITRVCRAYPHLIDDGFVRERLALWRS